MSYNDFDGQQEESKLSIIPPQLAKFKFGTKIKEGKVIEATQTQIELLFRNYDTYEHFIVQVDTFRISYLHDLAVSIGERSGKTKEQIMVINDNYNIMFSGNCKLIDYYTLSAPETEFISVLRKPLIQARIKIKDISKARIELELTLPELNDDSLAYLKKLQSTLNPRRGLVSLELKNKPIGRVHDYTQVESGPEEALPEQDEICIKSLVLKSLDLSKLDLGDEQLQGVLGQINLQKYLKRLVISLTSSAQLQMLVSGIEHNTVIDYIHILTTDGQLLTEATDMLLEFVGRKRWINTVRLNDLIVYSKGLVYPQFS